MQAATHKATLTDYYDQLAQRYRLMYRDWDTAVRQQAVVLDGVIQEFFGSRARRILDAACGIGTQAIGLAQLGYQVSGSDLSSAELGLARCEAARRGLTLELQQADMRRLREVHPRAFDVVIACDNAIAHLLDERDIDQAFRQFHRCTVAGGGCLMSVRDYASLERGGSRIVPRHVHQFDGRRTVLFDVWDFEGEFYDMTTYVVEDDGRRPVSTRALRGGRYWCVGIDLLTRLLSNAGFARIAVLSGRFFQPLIVARKR